MRIPEKRHIGPLVCIGGRFKQLQMEVLNVTMKQKEAEK